MLKSLLWVSLEEMLMVRVQRINEEYSMCKVLILVFWGLNYKLYRVQVHNDMYIYIYTYTYTYTYTCTYTYTYIYIYTYIYVYMYVYEDM